MENALSNLPPEMQARLAQIMAGATQPETPHQAAIAQPAAPAAQAQPAPAVAGGGQLAPKPPSLMDHVIALRQEVAILKQQLVAQGQVVEAVGNAVGQLYAMFQPSPSGNAQGQTYSESFQNSVDDSDY